MNRLPLVVIALAACKGEPTPIVVEPVTFLTEASVDSVSATLPPATVAAHDAQQALGAIVGLMATDIDVQQMLNVTPTPFDMPCWTTSVAGNSRTMTYQLCGTTISGSASIERTPPPSTTLLSTTPNFSFGATRLAGTLAMTEIEEASSTFEVFPSDVPEDALVVHLNQDPVGLELTGHFMVEPLATSIISWGTGTASTPDGDVSFTYGGATPADVETSTMPGDALRAPFLSACRCSSAGTLAYTTTLESPTVSIDLGSAIDNGGTLWPSLPVEVTTPITGTLIVEPTECGEWAGSFVTTEAVQVTGDALRAAIELGCTSNSFNDAEACERARQGAVSVDSLDLTFSDRVWREAAEALADQFDNGFCELQLQ